MNLALIPRVARPSSQEPRLVGAKNPTTTCPAGLARVRSRRTLTSTTTVDSTALLTSHEPVLQALPVRVRGESVDGMDRAGSLQAVDPSVDRGCDGQSSRLALSFLGAARQSKHHLEWTLVLSTLSFLETCLASCV